MSSHYLAIIYKVKEEFIRESREVTGVPIPCRVRKPLKTKFKLLRHNLSYQPIQSAVSERTLWT